MIFLIRTNYQIKNEILFWEISFPVQGLIKAYMIYCSVQIIKMRLVVKNISKITV